mmetsp:Transcript_12770/g.38019  ORF Transcript_12770/g.38019 Transcript_12770/m.38019 type:complete len:630 (+) Transcript_12770:460-2349(+)
MLAWLAAGTGIQACVGPFEACSFEEECDSDGDTIIAGGEGEIVRPDERSTTAMRDSLMGRSIRPKRRGTHLITAPVESVYEIGDILGSGAYGTVRRCLHRARGEECAVKTVSRSEATPAPDDAPDATPMQAGSGDIGAARRAFSLQGRLRLGAAPVARSLSRGLGGGGTGDGETTPSAPFSSSLSRSLTGDAEPSAAAIDEALRKEIDILTNMHHPHIIELYDVFDDPAGGRVHIVMPLCRGGELFARVHEGGAVPEVDAAVYAQQMLGAVEYLHSQGIVHRDLKPENFLFRDASPDADLLLIDFGVSTFFHAGRPLDAALGTLIYTAPEVFDGEYDERCDVWSVGVIVYVLLAGRAPFADARGRDYKVVAAIRTREPRFDGPAWAARAPEARAFTAALLAKDPAARPSAAEALGDAWFAAEHVSALAAHGEGAVVALGRFRRMHPLQRVARAVVAAGLTEAEVGHLRQQFRLLDADGDGVLTACELVAAIRELEATEGGTSDALHAFEASLAADAARGGAAPALDADEFVAATFHAPRLGEDALRAAYAAFDADGDGAVTVDELQVAFGSRERAQEMLDLVDADGDGVISFDEFREMMALDAADDAASMTSRARVMRHREAFRVHDVP